MDGEGGGNREREKTNASEISTYPLPRLNDHAYIPSVQTMKYTFNVCPKYNICTLCTHIQCIHKK